MSAFIVGKYSTSRSRPLKPVCRPVSVRFYPLFIRGIEEGLKGGSLQEAQTSWISGGETGTSV
jgi:hypothetical protein